VAVFLPWLVQQTFGLLTCDNCHLIFLTFDDDAIREMKGMPERSLSPMRLIYAIDTHQVLDEIP
jgi:hypothetical protein